MQRLVVSESKYPTEGRFPFVNFVQCVIYTLSDHCKGLNTPWTRLWRNGAIADPSIIVRVGNLLFRSIEQRSPTLQTLSNDIMGQHWPLTPIVKSALKDAKVRAVFDTENANVTWSLDIPLELMFRLTAADWDTLVAYCLASEKCPLSRHVLLFRTDQSLVDFVYDNNQTLDMILEVVLGTYHLFGPDWIKSPYHRNAMQRLRYMIDYAQKQSLWTNIDDIASVLLLPTVEMIQLADPVIDWGNAKFSVPDAAEKHMQIPVASYIVGRLNHANTEASRRTASAINEVILIREFETKMDIVDE